jgi:hypothetical protein
VTGLAATDAAVEAPTTSRGPAAVGRALLACSILGLALWRAVTDYLAGDITVGGTSYRVGDWVINYAGGFVRRGLFGQLLFAATPPGEPTLWTLFGFQAACYAVVLAYVLGFLHGTGWAWPAIALACGPAALPFVGWDVGGGWRKEIIGFAAIALLAWARAAAKRLRVALTIVAVLLFGLAMFSWEASVFAVPVMLHLLRRDGRWFGLRGWPSVTIIGLALAGGIASVLARGSQRIAWAVCGSVVDRGLSVELCGGAIARLAQTPAEAVEQVAVRFPLYWGYVLLLPLALLPVVTTPWLRRNWPVFAATAATIAPLYLLGEDWGRWAHLLVMAPALATMAGGVPAVASGWWKGGRTAAYVGLWGFPHWMFADGTWPLLGFSWALLDLFNPY